MTQQVLPHWGLSSLHPPAQQVQPLCQLAPPALLPLLSALGPTVASWCPGRVPTCGLGGLMGGSRPTLRFRRITDIWHSSPNKFSRKSLWQQQDTTCNHLSEPLQKH